MPAEVHVHLDERQLKEYEQALSTIRKGVPRVQSWAIRRTVTESRRRITRGISSEIAIPQKKLYERGSRRRPIHERLNRRGGEVVGGRVTIDKGRLPLGRFKPKQHWKAGRTQGRVRTRVSYKINKSGGRRRITDAFLLEFSSGYMGIFRRQPGDTRGTRVRGGEELHEQRGPSIPQVADNNPAVQRVLNSEAGEIYLANVSQRTQYLLERV